jgi:hypothetical protein
MHMDHGTDEDERGPGPIACIGGRYSITDQPGGHLNMHEIHSHKSRSSKNNPPTSVYCSHVP